jgi:hypothetical protein
MPDPSASTITRSPRWPWVVLGFGLVWTVLIRVPLILNAEDHLDSDLAVDGLTLIDALHGQWRWHYPGTPHMGILPMFFSYPQALIWGASAVNLVSGGTLIWLLIVAGTFWLAWKTYGPSVAGWAILPLIFSSTGTIWLSGRITGGHLLTLGWHTFAFVGLHACLSKGGLLRAAGLGLWCGLGLYLDLMFLFTLIGLVPAAILGWIAGGRWRLNSGTVAAFVMAAIVGFAPHEMGRLTDSYNAYPSQFTATLEGPAIREHWRLLTLHCLPRLIAGPELSKFDRSSHRDDTVLVRLFSTLFDGRTSRLPPVQEWLAIVLLVGFSIAIARLALDRAWSSGACRLAIGCGTTISAFLIVAAFLVNRNIFNSDNYRYLIYLITPWSLGFGLLVNNLFSRGLSGRVAGVILVFTLICGMTASTMSWYRDELGYIDLHWKWVRVSQLPWYEVPVLSRRQHDLVRRVAYVVPPDVTHVFGDYWDVYRMAFISGKKVVGVPYPMYPNRFRGWSRGLGPDHGKLLAIGVRREWGARAPTFRPQLPSFLPLNILEPPNANQWQSPFSRVWQNDGRDPAEIDRIPVVLPSSDRAGR